MIGRVKMCLPHSGGVRRLLTIFFPWTFISFLVSRVASERTVTTGRERNRYLGRDRIPLLGA